MKKNYKLTFGGCLIAISAQAVVASVTAILFVPFMELYGFELWQLGVLIAINFFSQLIADIILTTIIDKISYRKVIIVALVLAFVGLSLFASTPLFLEKENMFMGLIIATIIFSFSGGMQEVVVSPITESIPTSGSKSFRMSLLHSFYAWGQIATILIVSLFLLIFGYENWHIIMFVLAFVPIVAVIMFCICPMEKVAVVKGERKKAIFSPFMFLCFLAIFFGGGSEIIANQYISTFCSLSLNFPKYIADIVGMGLFAFFMALGRVFLGKFSEKHDISKILLISAIFTCILYLIVGIVDNAYVGLVAVCLCGLSTSLLWPGVLTVASAKFPTGGATIFALLAICGDLGASILPATAGFVADATSLKIMFAIMAVVPLLCIVCHALIVGKNKKDKDKQLKENMLLIK